MPLDPNELESIAKAGRVVQVLSDRPALCAKFRDFLGLGTEQGLTLEQAALAFHRIARAVEVYGRRVGSADFNAALEAFLDDSERGVAQARTLAQQAMERQAFPREKNPFPDPIVVAKVRAAPAP